ncbi:hypothetical protein C8F04DRAFT_1277647 [Mycena alexandri]|uniref:Uncharacterized protein n=1 Tax=Mycena alexandri TaxID=1745969 RepID=A0AAD6S251_9AGAR|nr:hypothetical protein C8F04DRAFT_1277647 [Mycena alexandri]
MPQDNPPSLSELTNSGHHPTSKTKSFPPDDHLADSGFSLTPLCFSLGHRISLIALLTAFLVVFPFLVPHPLELAVSFGDFSTQLLVIMLYLNMLSALRAPPFWATLHRAFAKAGLPGAVQRFTHAFNGPPRAV